MKWILCRLAVGLIVTAAIAVMPVLGVAEMRGAVPGWLVWCAAPVVITLMALAVRPLLPLTKRPIREDESLPWRSFGIARRCEVICSDEQDVSLILEVLEEGLQGPGVTLRFVGVSGLSLQQLGPWCVVLSGMVCEVLREPDDDGACFLVRDLHQEALRFRCRSFAQVAL